MHLALRAQSSRDAGFSGRRSIYAQVIRECSLRNQRDVALRRCPVLTGLQGKCQDRGRTRFVLCLDSGGPSQATENDQDTGIDQSHAGVDAADLSDGSDSFPSKEAEQRQTTPVVKRPVASAVSPADADAEVLDKPVQSGSKLAPQASLMADRPAMLATNAPPPVTPVTPVTQAPSDTPPPVTSPPPKSTSLTVSSNTSLSPTPPPSRPRPPSPSRTSLSTTTPSQHTVPRPIPNNIMHQGVSSATLPFHLPSVTPPSDISNVTPLVDLPTISPPLHFPPDQLINPLPSSSSSSQQNQATPPIQEQTSQQQGPNQAPPPDFASQDEDVKSETMVHPFHLVMFAILLLIGILFATVVTNFTTDMGFIWSAMEVARKLAKSLAFRQSLALMVAIAFVRYGLQPLVKSVRNVFSLPGPWERSNEYFVLQQVYRPLEFLLFIAAISTVVEAVLPPLMAISKETVRQVVRTMLSLTYVIASARVVFNIKARFVLEKSFQAELLGDVSMRRRIEATDKLMSLLVLFVASLLGLQAAGLDINSVLAISGFGGLALGLAGREILENLFNGLLIISNRSFEVGEEILFTQAGTAGRIVEGIVLDIGWYRTLIRSFEREVYVIPNSVFSRTVVLNVSRKAKEWRFYEKIGVHIDDVDSVKNIVSDMRRIIRLDPRVLQKLHRRVFLDKVCREQIEVYISFYVEAANRDAFQAAKQDMLLAFIGCVRRHGAQLATNKLQVESVEKSTESKAMYQSLLPEFGIELYSPDDGLQPFDPKKPLTPGPV